MFNTTLSKNLKIRLVSSLKTRLMCAFLLTAFVPIVGVSVLMYFQASRTLETNRFAYLEGMTGAKGQNIITKITARKQAVAAAANSIRLAATMIQNVNAPPAEDAGTRKQLLDYLNGMLGEKNEFEEVCAVDPAGVIRESTNPDNKGRDISRTDYYQQGREETVLKGELSSDPTGAYRVMIAAPVRGNAGQRLGVLVARLNLADQYETVTDVTGLRNTGLSYIGVLDGDHVRIISPLRNEPQSPGGLRIKLTDQAAVPIREAALGRAGQGVVRDYRGQQVVAVWLHIPDIGWGLVTRLDLKEFQQPLTRWRTQVSYIGLVVLVLTGIGAHLLAAKIVRPIVAVTEAAERFSRRELDVTIDLESEDEIGKLAASFSRMVSALKFYKETSDGKS